MKLLCSVILVQSIVCFLLVQGSFAQNKNLADTFVGSAAGKAASPGEQSSHRKAVDELFGQIGMALTYQQVVHDAAAALTSVNLDDAAYQGVVDAYVMKYVGWDAMKDEIAQLYMKTFTEKEIWDLVRFYNTTAGRKLLEQSQAMTQAISASVNRRLAEHSTELKEMMMQVQYQDFKKVLQDHGLLPATNATRR